MTYSKQTWVDGDAGGTPINAARLGHLEDGVAAAHALIPDLAPLTSRVTAVEGALPGRATTTYVDTAVAGRATTSYVDTAVAARATTAYVDSAVAGVSGSTPTGVVNVLAYGAVGDGAANDTAALQNAINATPAGGVLLLPAGKTFRVTAVTLAARDITVLAHGAVIYAATADTFAVTQSNRNRTTWIGGRFTGLGSGFKLNLGASDVQSYDFAFTGVSFDLPSAQTGMYLVGGREGTITNCWFDNCTGVRLSLTVNTQIIGCQFRNCTKGVWGDGTGSDPHNAGVMLNSCTMLGCGYGVHITNHDWASIVNCMIDFCDRPVIMVNPDGATITGSYFSNREMAGGTSVVPVIQITHDAAVTGESPKHVRISGCDIINNVGALPAQAVGIKFTGEADWCSVTNCTIQFWRKYAIQFTNTEPSTYIKIVGNDMVTPLAATGAAGICGASGNDSTWLIADNSCNTTLTTAVVAPVLRNNFT